MRPEFLNLPDGAQHSGSIERFAVAHLLLEGAVEAGDFRVPGVYVRVLKVLADVTFLDTRGGKDEDSPGCIDGKKGV